MVETTGNVAEVKVSAEAAVVAEAQAAEDAARAEAAKTLKALVKSYRAGEAAYRKGLLEAGRLANEYILQRVALRDTREAAVQTIAGRLAEECASKVDVNKLVRCYWAWHLLGAPLESEGDKASKAALDALPYRHLRD